MSITLDRYLYLDADKKKVVEEGDPAARFVLGGPGSVISDEDAKLYGLEEYLKRPQGGLPKADGAGRVKRGEGDSPSTLDTPPSTPKATQPEQNKAAVASANKGK